MVRHFYAGSNSSLGFYSLFDDVLKGLNHLYILKGGPGTGKSTLIKNAGALFEDKGLEVDYIHCSSDVDSLDGVIVPKLSVGIVDGTAPHIVDPKYPGVIDKIVDLGNFRDDAKLLLHKEEIIQLTNDISTAFSNAYQSFAESKRIHDELEDIYIEALDFEKANQVTEELRERFFSTENEGGKPGKRAVYFFGANTPSGPVHYYDNLTQNCTKRVILKGRAGSGKSTLLKKLARAAQDAGYDVDIYYCSFDPNSVDMIIVPELQVAIFDGTAPHEMEPTRQGDEVVDLFERCMDTRVESDKKVEIERVESGYKTQMQEGIRHLKQAKALHDKLEAFYVEAMDFTAVKQKQEALIEEILNFSSSKTV
ncbi:energy-coupling factor transporter ATP-binding protein EcfA2 [Pullulanibacillus pueri]|uniref:Uncharacterized protein n=1 Tax=Pullulanibacillus pueri TaxID=1437324 RepID=A0A8J2ZZK4_9BACL|nr:PRK06851 family protein [Pullulanibacillus pueri]MBM7681691.1 energy-coupling factor transporter ATP-binding protein EcfA2 [Pullulanibacillus pueri]GGH87029.1 hypothetical protein GCM10007096_36100 [Pullulanibacillus pueri]